jgi:hypothetical protein
MRFAAGNEFEVSKETTITLTLADPALAAHVLGVAAIKYEADKDADAVGICTRIANQIKEQTPEPVPAEPEGDVMLWVFGTAYKRPGSMRAFYPFANGPSYEWSDLIAECDRTKSARPVVYRREAAGQ